MPCTVDYVGDHSHGLTIRDFEAILCGILSSKESIGSRTGYDEVSYLLSHVDWKEVGVKRKTVEKWWLEHKKEDQIRRALEQKELEKQKLKANALSKLTAEERKALGF